MVGVGAAWFLIGLSLTFVMPLFVLVSEHRSYISSAGFLIASLGALGHHQLIARQGLALRGTGSALLVFLALLTWQRNNIWLDGLSLWQDAVAKAPHMSRGHQNLGVTLEELGQVEAAKRSYERALALQPDMADALKNLGRLYLSQRNLEMAEDFLNRSLAIDDHYVQTHVNLGSVYLKTGRWRQAAKRLESSP
jgi:tetratricopeptide (TPR) repeat protein